MARKPKLGPGRCVHCGDEFMALTGDHVFPEGWYPEDTPQNMEKWQAPSCESCNAKYGKIEKRLLEILALGTDPRLPGAKGVAEKALRSFDPAAAKSPRDLAHRRAALEKKAGEFQYLKILPDAMVLPNLISHPPGPRGHLTLQGDELDIGAFAQKMMRGFSYIRTRKVLPPEYQVTVFSLTENENPALQELFRTPTVIVERGPGFSVSYHLTDAEDDPFSALYRIVIWQTYLFVGAIAKQ
jgi:hypothetical protein